MMNAPLKSSQIVEIERLGLAWHEEAQYDYSAVDMNKRVQVRATEHYAPPTQVAQYAVQMGETQFPPILVTRNGFLIDGNTRKLAKEKRKEKFGAAIVIDADYGKNDKTDALIRALAATLNQQGGQRLTPHEMKAVGRDLIAIGWKPEQIARATGLKTSLITQLRKELDAETKFAKIGFKHGDKLQPAIKRLFGSKETTILNDVPYQKLLELALDANLNVTEVRELVKAMREIGSDAGMITFIDGKRDEMSDRIRDHHLSGNGKAPVSAQLRRHLGFILNQKDDIASLVELVPAAMDDHLTMVSLAIEILEQVKVSQEKRINA